jgi:TP901 family phage tail tape measure protein
MAIFIPLVTKFDPKGLQGAQRALANFQNFAVDVGRVAATAIAAVGVASVKEAAQFENAFTRIRTLTSLSAEDAEYLQTVAREIGPAYGVSAREAAEGLYFITSAGFDAAESATILESALKSQFIGMGDVATIADLVTSAMYSFNDSELTAEGATNALLKAIRAAKAEPEELADAMGRVLPVASAMGISFEESAALAGILSQGGLDASEAMTALRGVMNSLLVPTAQAEDTLARYGFTAQEVRDSIEQDGLFNTLVTLDEAFGDNATAVGEVFGNVRALTGVFSLMGDSMEENAEIVGYVTNGVDELSDAVDIAREDSLNKFNVAMQTARDSLIEVGGAVLEMLLPHLETFSEWMSNNKQPIEDGFIAIFDAINKFLTSEVLANIIEKFKDMWPEIKETVFQLGELVAILAPILLDAINDILPVFKDLADIMGDLGFFTEEVLGLFGEWEGETPNIVDFLNRQINPMQRLKDSVAALRDVLNAARDAYERLRSVGLELREGGAIPGQFGGRRAGGGPVSSGRGYLVGEMGPELFVPSSGGGTIIPNNQMGGGAKISITVNAGMGANGAQIGEQIVTAIKRYERTSGPVFASA